jgi:ubiquinol-cytochrome c reductase iron-sulfur subunit
MNFATPLSASVGHRRDFLMVAGSTFAAVGGAMALWPMLDQMNPDASTLAQASIEIDVASLVPGQAMTVMWRRKPVFIRHRTPAEIAAARDVPLESLRDGRARNLSLSDQADARDANRVIAGREQWLVVLGVCTHLGCVPRGQTPIEARGAFGGWLCSCHWSQYDTSGRIRQGPAPRNLDVPPYAFLSDTNIRIG